jgi:NhaP-type Na+/H+ or K+/H+ antiporter
MGNAMRFPQPWKRQGGRDVAKSVVAVLALFVISVLVSAQETGPKPPTELRFDSPAALTGSALTCSAPQLLRVPAPIVERAKIKARLMNLLRESLFDDAKGIVNIAREKEIRKLASKLKNSE